MKRTRRALLLTILLPVTPNAAARAQVAGTDIEVTGIVALRAGVADRLCPGADNAVRVLLAWHGTPPARPVSLRLELLVPGGPPVVLLAEGSATPLPGSAAGSFTFLHIEVPQRLRGRGARLVARANADGAIPERDPGNDRRELPLDPATDWSCRAPPAGGHLPDTIAARAPGTGRPGAISPDQARRMHRLTASAASAC